MKAERDTIVIGGGFFGCSLALHLRRVLGRRVILFEREERLLGRASYVNQARVHGGYHYPRSFLTALRSHANYARFVEEFENCLDTSFEKYYAIGRKFSNVTAAQFRLFCERIGAPIEAAPPHVRQLFNPDLIEDVFRVRECAFDAVKLARVMQEALTESGVEVRFKTEAKGVQPAGGGLLELGYEAEGQRATLLAGEVFNCTYSRLNALLAASDLPLIPLKHELAEMALIEVPPPLKKIGVTVMCGPFFSVMPFPSRGLHSLSHVRYTPHHAWHTTDGPYRDAYRLFERLPKASNYLRMLKDAERYLPPLGESCYAESIWEIKTVLPRSETDDSRPILLKRNYGLPNLHCVAGAKVDNIYDVLDVFSDTARRSPSPLPSRLARRLQDRG